MKIDEQTTVTNYMINAAFVYIIMSEFLYPEFKLECNIRGCENMLVWSWISITFLLI